MSIDNLVFLWTFRVLGVIFAGLGVFIWITSEKPRKASTIGITVFALVVGGGFFFIRSLIGLL